MSSQDLPYGKPFMFKMINAELSSDLDSENYDLGLPNVSIGQFNTEVIIRPYKKTKLYGRHYFKYNRLELNDLDTPISIMVNGETTLSQLLPKINELPLFDRSESSPLDYLDELEVPYIGQTEIMDKSLPPFGSSDHSYITMVARPNSYLLVGVAEIKLLKPLSYA